MSPAYLIIGAQKAGTTFLHQELSRHPQVRHALTKEIHYLDDHFDRGLPWYLGHFGRMSGPYAITGESSPGYLFHPHAPMRARTLLPGVRAIVLLRDPVSRAYSHFRHERRLGFEPEASLARAIELEPLRTTHEIERVAREPGYVSHAARHFTYVARGHYAPQIERWIGALGRSRVKIIMSSSLYERPRQVLDEVERFLGLDPWQPGVIGPNDMANGGPPLDAGVERDLRERYRESDQHLRQLLGHELGWAS